MRKLVPSLCAVAVMAVASHAHAAVCSTTINASKTWAYDTPAQIIGSDHWQFSVGAGASVGAKGDCNAISVAITGSIRARAFSVGGDAFLAQLTAATTQNHMHTIVLSLYAFGHELVPRYSTADTRRLHDNVAGAYTLPVDMFEGDWTGRYDFPADLGSGGYSGHFGLVADIMGLVSYDVAPDVLFGAFCGHGEVTAAVTTSASYATIDHKLTASCRAAGASRCRTAATTSRSIRATPTRWRPASGPTTRSSPG